ncbi:PREDICTED: COMM domain-containing protein 7-like [Acromyrmex echinatior]|uniref:COMM domain-containing protein 7 n=1 Tax=Acromyrmex echinatior TaxID=103372 RepID=F4X0G4_ACREC|nr:PREDICTED: COMM domain-containing protein 7-like [Acromyrmex echinatior]EGI59956.1 COMM domain-containing protein 7 [Acromyrmex echinatior]
MDRGISKILDISWRFGVTTASDCDNVAKSFLQLKLCLENDGIVKNVFTEMTIGQFYKFLHDLEKAKCNLDLLL